MKEKLIYIAPHFSSFVNEDISLLSKDFDVIVNVYNWNKKKYVPILLIKQLLFLLFNVKSYDKVIISFGGYWSLIPVIICRIFNKKSFIILNGTDCCSLPSLNYGNLRKPLLRFFTKISFKYTTELLPVSSSLVYTENKYYTQNSEEIKQGYKAFFKSVKTPYTVVPNAIDSSFWRIINNDKRIDNSFTAVFSEKQFILKGGDLIVELAKRNPTWNFTIVGTKDRWGINLENVKFVGFVDKFKLLEIYNNSKYYLQLSIFEGFGCSLCEAILCGCIPIGSNVNEIPKIIENTSNILMKKSVNDLESLINDLHINTFNIINNSSKIINNYSIKNRKNLLLEVFKK